MLSATIGKYRLEVSESYQNGTRCFKISFWWSYRSGYPSATGYGASLEAAITDAELRCYVSFSNDIRKWAEDHLTDSRVQRIAAHIAEDEATAEKFRKAGVELVSDLFWTPNPLSPFRLSWGFCSGKGWGYDDPETNVVRCFLELHTRSEEWVILGAFDTLQAAADGLLAELERFNEAVKPLRVLCKEA